MLKKALLMAIISFGMIVGTNVNSTELTKKDVEKIVQQYIAKNGKEIQKSLERAEQKESFNVMMEVIRPYTPSKGPKNAPVTLVEFSDFECPFCRRVQPTLDKIMERYNGRIRHVFKHSPLEQLHPRAIGASYASQAAQEQGKFWEFRRKIFERQEFSGEKLWNDVAQEIGLDMDKYEKARKSVKVKKEVAQDLKDAAKVGVRGTPFFLINGIAISGALPFDKFVEVIESQLSFSSGK